MSPRHRLGAVVVSRTGEGDTEGPAPRVVAFDRVVDAVQAAALEIRGAQGPRPLRASAIRLSARVARAGSASTYSGETRTKRSAAAIS